MIMPKAHLEVAKNKNASIRYCSKAETRTGSIYTTIPLPENIDTAQVEKKLSKTEQKKLDFEKFEKWYEELTLKVEGHDILEKKLEKDKNYIWANLTSK